MLFKDFLRQLCTPNLRRRPELLNCTAQLRARPCFQPLAPFCRRWAAKRGAGAFPESSSGGKEQFGVLRVYGCVYN